MNKYHKNYYKDDTEVYWPVHVSFDQTPTRVRVRARKVVLITCLAIILLALCACTEDMMVKCQEKYSYETCFYTLNR